ncbi:MAG TPA: hypothetical protein VD788_12610 [Candidatus Polarisedimenticolaceae bacterium]|nr:hypothetical protein [Candidatus Polarisedimenticolaceae bacterium]
MRARSSKICSRARTLAGAVVASVLLVAVIGCVPLAGGDTPQPLLIGRDYPIEAGISFPFALLHWLDSLAGLDGPGMTAGKTIEAHRREYVERLGAPDDATLEQLREFVGLRWSSVKRLGRERRHALSLVFLEARDLDQALAASSELLSDDERDALRRTVERFAPLYRSIWDDGEVARRFVDGVRGHDAGRALARFLTDVARFYGVPPDRAPHPRIVPLPVVPGYGTHAQAIDRHLLIEIRDGERLLDEIAPIVHENAHFLFYRIDERRRERLEAHAASIEPGGIEAWRMLHEALPTAIGQGVAVRRFAESAWSMNDRWYHVDEIDAYAKRVYPLVRDRLATGGELDESFIDMAVALYVGERPPITPRSP